MDIIWAILLAAFTLLCLLFSVGGLLHIAGDGSSILLLVPVVFAVSLWGYVYYKRGGFPPI